MTRRWEDVGARIKNEGPLDLKNVTLLLKHARVIVGISYRVIIPFIATDDEAEVVFKVQASLNILTVCLEYPNGYSEEERLA